MTCASRHNQFLLVVGVIMGVVISLSHAQDAACEMSNCDDCMNPGLQCAMCQFDHVASSDMKQCYPCPTNCDTCKESGDKAKCSACDYGFYATNDGAECGRCSSKCGKCDPATVGSTCKSCSPGYHLLAGNIACQGCSANCVDCVDKSLCLQCLPRFYLQNDGLSVTCQACPGGVLDCESCTDGSKCDKCRDGKYWDGTTCADCIANCKTCENGDTCVTCVESYVLSAESTCHISKTHCSLFTDGTGCTECDQGYLLVDNMCQKCPNLETPDVCNQCHSDTTGRYYDNVEKRCDYCPMNCLDCDAADTCNVCVAGKVWSTVAMACVDCGDDVASLVEADCNICDGLYFDGTCAECPAALADADTMARCSGCSTDEHGYFWADGTCSTVDCTVAGLSEVDCAHCIKKYWDGDSCEDVDCTVTAALDTAPECVGCSTDAATKSWTPATCEPVLCGGTLDNKDRCNHCANKYFNSAIDTPECMAIDCSTASLYKTASTCNACPGFYFDGSSCIEETNCATNNLLDSIEKCVACRMHLKQWDEANTVCIDAVCNDLASLDETGCNSCSMSDPSTLLKWNVGTSACEAAASGICTGDLSDNTLTDLEWLCTFCPQMMWSGDAEGTCEALNCQDTINLEETCTFCDGRSWDPINTACDTVDCTATLSTEADCNACGGYVWNVATSTCAGVNCEADLATYILLDEASCLTCYKRTWAIGYCEDVVCSNLATLNTAYKCVACNKYWNSVTGMCENVNCATATLDSEMKCQTCSDKYWNGVSCKDKVACETAIIHSTQRCSSCSTFDHPTSWDPSTGHCYNCPENCVTCNEDQCVTCKEGYVWEDNVCKDCTTAALTVQETCTACAGNFWSQSAKCEACPDNCEVCSSKYLCTRCATGMVWDNVASACVGCVHEDAETCEQCGTTTRGNYFIDPEFCYGCPVGCTLCDGTSCSECTTGFYLDKTNPDAHVCTACAAPFTTEEECDRCGGAKKFWDGSADPGTCSDCMAECATCSSSTTCDTCPGGFYKNAEGRCKNCVQDCITCTGNADCTFCSSNKYFSENKCVNCPSHCAQCDNPGGCSKCSPGYFLADGACTACLSGCAVCDNADTCKSCNTGSCLDVDGTKCHVTSAKCDSCTLAADTNTISCFTCIDRHFKEECIACSIEGCEECATKNTECTKCMGGYYMEGSTCKKCPSYGMCESCTDGTACGKCHAGYYLDGKDCKACGSGCAECSNGDSCTRCNSLSTAWDDATKKCGACYDHCSECSGVDSCRECASGYFIDGDQCTACPDNCHACTDGLTCTECDQGYYMDTTGVCMLCSEMFPYCGMCSSAGTCQWCEYGYALTDDGLQCIPCTVGACMMCEDPQPRCDKCSAEFYPTYNADACAPGCYVCDGATEDCTAAPGANSTVQACPGLGTSHFCEVVRSIKGEAEIDNRACSNKTCTEAKMEKCDYIGEGENKYEECRICCKEGKCNTQVPTGKTDSGNHGNPTSAPLATGILVAIATAAMVFANMKQ